MNSIFKTFLSLLILIIHFEIGYAQTASILPNAKTTYVDQNGKPLTSGTVEFFIPGTSTHKLTWQDAGQSVPNTNPVVLDSAGRAIIFGDGSYRQVLKDRYGNIIWDGITSSAGSSGGGSTPTVGDGDAVGTVKAWSGFLAPYGYVTAYGQEIVRASYPEAFDVLTSKQNVSCTSGSPTLTGVSSTTQLPIGAPIESSCLNAGATIISKTVSTVTASSNAIISTTTTATFFPFGNGDGSLTFNVPDLRGRVIAGNDGMGGIAANRLTSTYFGISADALGANGGGQSFTIATTNLPPYTPSGTVTSSWSQTSGQGNLNSRGAAGGADFNAASLSIVGTSPPVSVTGTVASAFTGIAQGGSSTPLSTVQPTQTQNYIIKVIPDSNPNSFFGVASIGGMYGVIECGFGLTCAGNIISAVNSTLPTPTSTVLGGVFASDAPANEFAIGIDLAGNVLYGGGSTTVNGQTCTIGGSCTITASAGTMTVGTTTVSGGSTNGLLYKDGGGLLASATSGNNGILTTNGSGVPSIVSTLPTINLPAFSGDVTTPSGSNVTTIASNVVNNSKIAQAGAATIKGNPTVATTDVQDFTIQGLVNLASPDATLDYLPIYDHLTGTIKNVTPGDLSSTLGQWGVSGSDIYYNAGNVGIGVISPTAQLNTSGSVKFNSLGGGVLSTDLNGNVNSTLLSTPQGFGAVGDGIADDTTAITNWLNYLASNSKSGICPKGIYKITSLVSVSGNKWGFSSPGGPTTCIINYAGVSTTTDILYIHDSLNVSITGLLVKSTTNMTGGAAIHLVNFNRGILNDVWAGGADEPILLWNGVWFDKIDSTTYYGVNVMTKNVGVMVNGSVGAGPKSGLFMGHGRILQCGVGLLIGGAFGGIYVDNMDIIANSINVLVNHSLAAEGNREIFFGTNVSLDSAVSRNILILDTFAANATFIYNGWLASSASIGVDISAYPNSVVQFPAGTNFNNTDSAVFINDPTTRVVIGSGVTIRNNGGAGVTGVPTSLFYSDALMFSNTGGNCGITNQWTRC